MSHVSATPAAASGEALRAAATPAARADILPAPLGPWLLEWLVGEGTFSRIYRARPASAVQAQAAGAARYAVKVLRDRWQDHPLALLRMRREATVGRCAAHRHVVPVLAAHVHRAPYYLVMPLLDGAPVAAHVAAQGRFDTPLALWIARQVAEGLQALHTLGYVHGDVTPANILVSPQGHATLVDLGCARRVDDDPGLDDAPLLGTPHYMAPELLAGSAASPRSDLYSLGMTLFEMLAGRLPVVSSDLTALAEAKRTGVLPSVRVLAPQVPSAVAQVVRRLTARQPLRRPQTAGDLVQELVRLEISTLTERVPAL